MDFVRDVVIIFGPVDVNKCFDLQITTKKSSRAKMCIRIKILEWNYKKNNFINLKP